MYSCQLLSAKHPLPRNLVPRRNEFYRERTTLCFWCCGSSRLDTAGTMLNPSTAILALRAPHLALEGVRSNQGKGQLWLIIFNEFSVRKW